MRRANAIRLHRKSGGAKPRDLRFSGSVVETTCCFGMSTDELGRDLKHFQDRLAELQIPPLRYAPVGMTKGMAALPTKVG
jgi:hypothetical protein